VTTSCENKTEGVWTMCNQNTDSVQ